MTNFNMVALYVEDAKRSAALYSELLEKPIVQSTSRFVVLQLGEGAMLGLWSNDNVEPRVNGKIGGSEVAFAVGTEAEVNATHERWKQKGLQIAQSPTKMNFGFTFVALDPDGHRIRVFAPPSA